MATTSSRARSKGSSASKRSRSGTAKRRRPNAPRRRLTEGHEADLAGLAVLVVAVVAALGVYARAAGPVGAFLDDLIGAAVGLGRFVAPPALAALGVALIRGAPPDTSRPAGQRRLGVGLVVLAALALLHVWRGPDTWPGPLAEVQSAGGHVGAAIGHPLRALLSPYGAVPVLLAVLVSGLLLVTRTSLKIAAARARTGAAAGVRPGVEAARRLVGELSTLKGDRSRGEQVAHLDPAAAPRPPLYDVAADDPSFAPAAEAASAAPDAPSTAPAGRRRRAGAAAPAAEAAGGPPEQLAIDLAALAKDSPWKLPALSVLRRGADAEVDTAAVEARGRVLEAALAAHGVETRLIGATVGPTVSRYELELGPGVKVARVTSLHKDIAYAMASVDVRILAPIPGKSAIGVEVPNLHRQVVNLGDILASAEAANARHPLEVAIGRDIAGRAVMMNLAKTPHLLIAGATGAGKSSAINCLLTSILMRSTPEQVRLILVDPKMVEMGQFARLPHLLTQVVTNPKKAANALQWACREMDRRYDLLSHVGFRDITGYNQAFDRGELAPEELADGTTVPYERLPYVVVVVDELNDLMMVAARDVEDSITRIAQKARAVGIHLVVATQRPSVNVITGVIKANIPARMAFAVASATDSRVILDQIGAERLIGQGDMLLIGPSSPVAQRIQGAWVTEEEIRSVVAHWRRQLPADHEAPALEGVDDTGDAADGGGGEFASGDDADDGQLVRAAMDLVVRSQLGSTSMLQRKLKVGFARAGRLMDLLEQRGVVGPSEGSKARAVLMTVEEYEELLRNERG